MRKEMILFVAFAVPLAVYADGDPRSFHAAPKAPPIVEAAPLPPPTAAIEAPPPPMIQAVAPAVIAAPVRTEGFGSDTRYWVASQIAGDQGVTELRPQSGEVATHVYDRYLKSFDHPIPEVFQRDSFDSGGSGASTR